MGKIKGEGREEVRISGKKGEPGKSRKGKQVKEGRRAELVTQPEAPPSTSFVDGFAVAPSGACGRRHSAVHQSSCSSFLGTHKLLGHNCSNSDLRSWWSGRSSSRWRGRREQSRLVVVRVPVQDWWFGPRMAPPRTSAPGRTATSTKYVSAMCGVECAEDQVGKLLIDTAHFFAVGVAIATKFSLFL